MKAIKGLVLGLLGMLALQPLVAIGQAYPSQPIRLIITVAPGGATDLLARIVGEKMSEGLKQPFIYDNRPGASGAIAAEAAARAPADGYNILVGSSSTLVLLPVVNPKLAYDPLRDFAPVGMMIRGDNAIVARASLNIKTLKELIAYAKKNPSRLFYGSVGIGTANHLAAELMSEVAGIDMTHVPYKSAAAVEADMIADRIDINFSNIPPALNNLRQGRTVALAVTSSKRSPALPDVPTATEAGYPLEIYGWGGLFAPAGTPRAAIDRIAGELKRVLAMPDVGERLSKIGLDLYYLGPDETSAFLKSELNTWRNVVSKRKIKFD